MPPTISQTKPQFSTKSGKSVPVTIIEIEDKDILKFVTGGLHGLKAINENRIKIAGDLTLASELEQVFIKTGGVEKAKQFFSKAKGLVKSKL